MNDKKLLIKRAIDSNAFTALSSAGTAVNPNIWDMKIREYQEANLVMTPLCEQFDFRGPGVDYRVTIDEAPSAAAAVVETNAISVSAYATRYTTFTPTEYGVAYQVSQKELNRAFFNVMERMSKKLGYSLALKKDSLAVTEAVNGAGTTILANNVSAATDIASTDTLGYEEIIDAARAIENNYYTPKVLVVNNYQKAQLLQLDKVNKANEFGSRDAIAKGLVGELFGIKIYATTQITVSNSRASAIMLGETGSGEKAIGYAIKQDPMLRTDYDVLGRFHTLAAHEEYDFALLHGGAIALITTYSA